MSAKFCAAFGPLVVAGAMFTGHPLDAHALGGLSAITVSPIDGKVTASFQVTYAISPCTSAAGLTIGFSWGALAPAGPVLGTAATDSTCRATLTTAPPAKTAPGMYQVFGYVALPTGAPAPNTEASASYKVDVTPAPTTTATASGTAGASAKTSASSQASASAAGGSGTSASASASAPGGSGTSASASAPVASGAAQSTGLTVTHSASPQAWWRLDWIGGGLVAALFILILSAFMIAWLLRRRRIHAAAPGKDKAA